ncbi:MAG: hypothetical protein JSW54_09010 [Fidelibacterota bacterium]|nr:MAG: hypothetical protein JSW54_09010 [Candidatus Neomarinimicrobiota bacterium]
MRNIAGVLMSMALCISVLRATVQPNGTDSLVATGVHDSPLGKFVLYLPADYQPEAEVYLRETTMDVALALITRFGPVTPAPFQLIIVGTREQLVTTVGGEVPEWIHALAFEHPPRVIILDPNSRRADPASDNLEQTLLHELTHVYLYRLYPSRGGDHLPGWLHEGLAVHISSGLDRGMHRALIRGRLTNKYYTLDQLDRIYHTSSILSELAYAQAAFAAKHMEASYGAGVFRSLFDELRMDKPFFAAFTSSTGESLEEFHARYESELRRQYNILIILGDPQVLFILLPILVLIAYLVRMWRNWRITQKWAIEGAYDERSQVSAGSPASDEDTSEKGI